ncbi:MAG: hypothetical protein MRZ86_06200 [Acidaminococcus sp.]|nr:hypothetical protein [Acidaminococcus sp.]MDY4559791.1 hypothetical protein [Eubacteriales bacterium]MDY5345002.1 hypothetical protein [Eubacteriales bacterium]
MYFRVIAKCGNLGKRAYVPISFAVKAQNAKEAVEVAKNQPYVRKDFASPIISITEIDKESYEYLVAVNQNDPFFKKGFGFGRLRSMYDRMQIETRPQAIEFI